jgi:hypothetical protein
MRPKPDPASYWLTSQTVRRSSSPNTGAPVAQIVPVHKRFAEAAAIDEWRRYRREHNITLGEGITIRELIEEGRE